ncbi:TonB-dependent receptor [Agarivorans sp. QJM3NY_25]|uniref:TonB-dependent receptor n=1 Tax=Agarivorans sp. QJM3NY_25 TaxID=3421430 RepID=UPI003D7C3F83
MKLSRLTVAVIAAIGQVSMAVVVPAWANDEETKLETIVVVGEKIDKNLKDTTSAVSVISAEDFTSSEHAKVNDIVTTVPNVTESGFGTISIRGIDGAGAATGGYTFYNGARTRISTIVDGNTQAWFGVDFMPSKLWDVRQVEVYRGPQSTTQGTNAIGGALVVVSNDPTQHWEGAVRLGAETYENGNLKSNLAFMSSGPLIEDELAFRIALDGQAGDGYINYAQDSTELDDSPDLSYSENLNARLKLLWQPKALPKLSVKFTALNQVHEGEYSNWANDVDSAYTTQTYTLSNAGRSFVRLQDSYNRSISSDIDYALTDSLNNSLHINLGSSEVSFEQHASALDVSSKTDLFSFENRLMYQNPAVDYSGVLGLYYAKAKTDTAVSNYYTRQGEVTTAAIYGEGAYRIHPQLKLIAGARVENEKNYSLLSYNTEGSDTSNSILLPKFGAIYDLNASHTLSASIRQGYNGGGYAYNWTEYEYYEYEEESVVSYEAALKSRFGAAELTTTLFYNDYSGYQALDKGGYFRNIDDSHTYGAELEATLWPSNDLLLQSSLGLLKSEIRSDDTAYAGAELPNAPKVNIAANFIYYLSEALSFGGDVSYVGSYYSDLENAEAHKAGDYITGNARLNYLLGDFSIDAYIKNISNEAVVTYVRSDGWAAVGQTRTFGIDLAYQW